MAMQILALFCDTLIVFDVFTILMYDLNTNCLKTLSIRECYWYEFSFGLDCFFDHCFLIMILVRGCSFAHVLFGLCMNWQKMYTLLLCIVALNKLVHHTHIKALLTEVWLPFVHYLKRLH